MRVYPQELHADLGITPDSDHTEDLRRTAPVNPVCPAPAGAALTHQSLEESR
jgi:hypothetical protein